MDISSQEEVRGLLGKGCFVRRCDQPTAFWVSDAPRRFAPDALQKAAQRLVQQGFTVCLSQNGLWYLDWADARWLSFLEPFAAVQPAELPARESLHSVYTLARLLWAHPTPWPMQPKELLRPMLKAYPLLNEIEKQSPQWLEACAKRLRLHQALPSAGAGVLFAWLRQSEGEMKT